MQHHLYDTQRSIKTSMTASRLLAGHRNIILSSTHLNRRILWLSSCFIVSTFTLINCWEKVLFSSQSAVLWLSLYTHFSCLNNMGWAVQEAPLLCASLFFDLNTFVFKDVVKTTRGSSKPVSERRIQGTEMKLGSWWKRSCWSQCEIFVNLPSAEFLGFSPRHNHLRAQNKKWKFEKCAANVWRKRSRWYQGSEVRTDRTVSQMTAVCNHVSQCSVSAFTGFGPGPPFADKLHLIKWPASFCHNPTDSCRLILPHANILMLVTTLLWIYWAERGGCPVVSSSSAVNSPLWSRNWPDEASTDGHGAETKPVTQHDPLGTGLGFACIKWSLAWIGGPGRVGWLSEWRRPATTIEPRWSWRPIRGMVWRAPSR